jgi:hypothetical protein
MIRGYFAGLLAALTACGGGASEHPDAALADASPVPDAVIPAPDARVVDYDGHSGACLLSADCPPGKYCDLGECRRDCDDQGSCPGGGTCSAHGRCLDSGEVDADPAPTTDLADTVDASPVTIQLERDQSQALLRVSSHLGTAFRVRAQSGAAWMTVTPARIDDAPGVAELGIVVDRASLTDGSHGAFVTVVTDLGTVVVPVQVEQALGGRYAGEVVFDGPPGTTTRLPLELDVKDLGAELWARIHAGGSPAFPNGATGQALIDGEGRIVANLSTLVRRAAALYPEDPWRGDFFGRPISREVVLTLNVLASQSMTGTYAETITGLLPEPFTVTGTVSLLRRGGEELFGSFLVAGTPTVPALDVTPPPLTAGCLGKLTGAGGCSTSPLDPCTAEEEVGVAASIRQDSWQLYDTFSPTQYFGNEVSDCLEDLDPLGTPTGGCVSVADNGCAEALFGRYLAGGGTDPTARADSVAGIVAALEDLLRVYTFVADDEVVRALDERLVYGSSVVERGHLAEALRRYAAGELMLLSPHRLAVLGSPEVSALADPEGLFSLAFNLLSRHAVLLEQEIALRMRQPGASNDALRAEVQGLAEQEFLKAFAWATVMQLAGIETVPQAATALQTLPQLARLFERVGPDRNPLGFSVYHVPFVFRPESGPPTNFEQARDQASTTVQDAQESEEAAVTANRSWEQEAYDLTHQYTELELESKASLYEICGGTEGEPNVDGCGTGCDLPTAGGQLCQELENVRYEQLGIELSAQRVQNVWDQVKVETDRAAAVGNVRQENIRVIKATGDALSVLTLMDAYIASMQQFMSIASNSNLWNAGAPLGLAAASALLQMERGMLAAEREQLQALQSAHVEESSMEIEFINSMATIKNLLLQLSTLSIEGHMQAIRAAQAAMRAYHLRGKVDQLLAQRADREDLLNHSPKDDPAYRLLRDWTALRAERQFEKALSKAYLAARAFEYETNTDYPCIESHLFTSRRAVELEDFLAQLTDNYNAFNGVYLNAQTYVDEVSLREDILGLNDPVTDPVTHEEVSPQEQFRRVLLAPTNLDGLGGASIPFYTSITEGNGVFSTLLCNDRITSIEVMLVGDFLGDNVAYVQIAQSGASLLRACDARPWEGLEHLVEYNITPHTFLVQAGVNSYGIGVPNQGPRGRSVAFASWLLRFPGGHPGNDDVDLTHLDDVVLKITHTGISLNALGTETYQPACQ